MSHRADAVPTLALTIVSAHGAIFDGQVRMVSVRSTAGELGILPRHSPLMTLLKPGEARLALPGGEEDYIYLSGGVMEVQPEQVTILADTALRGDQIDEAAALAAKRHAEAAMRTSVLYSDRDAAQVELVKALAQLKTLRDSRRKRGI